MRPYAGPRAQQVSLASPSLQPRRNLASYTVRRLITLANCTTATLRLAPCPSPASASQGGELAAAAAQSGESFFHSVVQSAEGNLTLLTRALQAANAPADEWRARCRRGLPGSGAPLLLLVLQPLWGQGSTPSRSMWHVADERVPEQRV